MQRNSNDMHTVLSDIPCLPAAPLEDVQSSPSFSVVFLAIPVLVSSVHNVHVYLFIPLSPAHFASSNQHLSYFYFLQEMHNFLLLSACRLIHLQPEHMNYTHCGHGTLKRSSALFPWFPCSAYRSFSVNLKLCVYKPVVTNMHSNLNEEFLGSHEDILCNVGGDA